MNMNESHRPDQDKSLDAPQELIDALADLDKERIFVPPSVDEAIVSEARQQLKGIACDPEPVNFLAWSGWGVAAAATVLLMFSLSTRQPEQAEHASASPESAFKEKALMPEIAADGFAREDINRDRAVDILDAFALARWLEDPEPPPAAFDFNNDGAIDRADVDWVARVSVKL